MPWDPIQLNDGNVMPSIAYGTWRTGKGQQPVDSLSQAFAAGIRHVDTAQNYTNEPEAGVAIRNCGLPRESIFVTTKWSGLDGLDVATSFKNSLKNLDLTYIDLYLIHGPEMCDQDGIEKCWKEMEKLKDSGLARPVTKRPGGPVDKPVGAIAKRLGSGVSMDQVLLAWVKAKGTVPVTMSMNKKRVEGYVHAGDLELSSQDIKDIDGAAGDT